jgi:hypothetical protein
MAKRWTLKDDRFLVEYHSVGANYVADHDLGFKGKNAGVKRMAKLKETGVWEKIEAYHEAWRSMNWAWVMAFGSQSDKDMIDWIGAE